MDRAHDTGKPSDELPDASFPRAAHDSAPRGQWQAIATEEMRREEQASDPSPPMTEIAETLGMHLCFVTATIARFWGLEINQDTPDFDALEALLKTRYGYWDDDIEHRSYFIHFQAG